MNHRRSVIDHSEDITVRPPRLGPPLSARNVEAVRRVDLRPEPVKDERRRHRRVSVELAVTLASEHNFYSGFAPNLSEGGLFVATYDLRPIGDEVELSFTLPTGHGVRTKGRVQWHRVYNADPGAAPPGMGVAFVALSEWDRRQILAFLRERDPLFYALASGGIGKAKRGCDAQPLFFRLVAGGLLRAGRRRAPRPDLPCRLRASRYWRE